jgi:hypothetical protein
VGHLFNPRDSRLTATDTNRALSVDAATGRRTLLRVPLYYAGLAPGSSVEVQWMESVLADDARSVDAARLARGGLVGGRVSMRLNGRQYY